MRRLLIAVAVANFAAAIASSQTEENKGAADMVEDAGSLDALWADLAGDDAMKAYRAIQTLIAAPAQSVPFLAERLRPVPAPDAKKLAALIAQLDAKDFQQREEAARQLAALGDLAEPALTAALRDRPPLELRRRLEKLLAGLPASLPAGEMLRQVRAIEVLDVIGSPEVV